MASVAGRISDNYIVLLMSVAFINVLVKFCRFQLLTQMFQLPAFSYSSRGSKDTMIFSPLLRFWGLWHFLFSLLALHYSDWIISLVLTSSSLSLCSAVYPLRFSLWLLHFFIPGWH